MDSWWRPSSERKKRGCPGPEVRKRLKRPGNRLKGFSSGLARGWKKGEKKTLEKNKCRRKGEEDVGYFDKREQGGFRNRGREKGVTLKTLPWGGLVPRTKVTAKAKVLGSRKGH